MPDIPTTKKSWSAVLKGLVATFGATALTFLGTHMWDQYSKTMSTIDQLAEQVKDLQNDKAKWATLAEIHVKTQELDKEVFRLKGIYEYEMRIRAIEGKPFPEQKTFQPPAPKADAPKLPEAPFDIDRYREMQQQKYPVQKK